MLVPIACCAGLPLLAAAGVSVTAGIVAGGIAFDGCPNHEAARALVERVSSEVGVEPLLRLVNVPDDEAARRLRFLGSPTIRVAGRDVEPQAAERDDYVLSCRVYRTESGFAGQPDERRVREALQREASAAARAASKVT